MVEEQVELGDMGWLKCTQMILLILAFVIAILMVPLNIIRYCACPASLASFFENVFPQIEAFSFLFVIGMLFWGLLSAVKKMEEEEKKERLGRIKYD